MRILPEVPEVQQVKISTNKLWYNLNLSRPVGRNWTKKEAHALIDMWAFVCWGVGSNFHKSMSHQVGLIPQLWNKQRGRCAVSGLELGGGPADGRRAIGIDIIKKKMGIRKGNIRLVCGPLAVTRWIDPGMQTKTVMMPNPENYEGYDITFAIVKHIEWAMRADFFKNLPVLVKFPMDEEDKDKTSPVPTPPATVFNIAEFSWFTMLPERSESEKRITGWECKKVDKPGFQHDFLRVTLQDDVITIYPFKKPRHGLERYESYGPRYGHRCHGIRVPLSDPGVDIIDIIIRRAKRSLILSMRYWYDKPYP
jgi:hypothetical protein